MQGLLVSQELAGSRKVDIVLGVLAGKAKRQVSVLEDNEQDQVRKSLLYLDSLYGDTTPTPLLRSQFFSRAQKPSETGYHSFRGCGSYIAGCRGTAQTMPPPMSPCETSVCWGCVKVPWLRP